MTGTKSELSHEPAGAPEPAEVVAPDGLEARGSKSLIFAVPGDRFRDIASAAGDCLWETDASGRYTFLCGQVERIFGRSASELVGRRAVELLGDDAEGADDVQAVGAGGRHAALEAAFAGPGRIRELEHRLAPATGPRIWLMTDGVPVVDAEGRFLGHRGIHRDITAQKAREAATRRARDTAEQASRLKSAFLTNMSHEIRTPMNAIIGYARLLEREEGSSKRQQQYLEAITQSGEHLLRVINDILEVSKIEAGKTSLALERFDFHLLLAEIERMFRVRTDERRLQLAVELADDVPRYLVGDGGRVRQVIVNLLSNAVKFTKDGGVVVRVRSRARSGGEVDLQVEVEDSGCGISEADQGAIFEAFEQAATGRLGQGTGLGLTISRRFAEMMRGSIGVSSTLGVGSVFDFRFVAERAGGLQEPTVEAKSRVVGVATLSGEIRVLVADGDLPSVGFLSELLERVGFAVRSARDGAGAIAVCRSWQPHCVIIDAKMPVIDGAEATAEMRQSPEGRDIPILMVSAGGEAEGIAIARACGASGFLRKPVREEDLLTLMGERLGIDLVYSQPSEAGPRRDDRWSREQVASAIPVALREELRDALEGGYVDRIAAAIGRVGQLQPELARMLTELAETFEYESILSLLAGGHLVGDEQST